MSGERSTRLDGRLLTSFHGAVFKKSDMPLPKVKDICHSKLNFYFPVEILSLCDSFSFHRNKREFYFDRSPRIFENILGLYRKGELHLTERVCPRDFLGKLFEL